jgi:uncharacterized protein YhaN
MEDAYDRRSRLELEVGYAQGKRLTLVRELARGRLVLRDPAGGDETIVREVLSGYDRDRFRLLFGFHHADLRAGGEHLLQSGGAAGISLFEAGGGLQFLQRTMQQLADQSAQLMDPGFRSNSAKKVNRAWQTYVAARRETRDASLSAEKWEQERAAIAQDGERLMHLGRQLEARRQEAERLHRSLRTAGLLSRRRELLDRLAADEGGPDWAEPEAQRLLQDLEAVEDLDRKLEGAADDRARLREREDGIERDPQILLEKEAVTGLAEQIRAYETAQTAIPRLEGEEQSFRAEAAAILTDVAPGLRLDQADSLRMPRAERRRLQRLVEARKKVQADLDEELETLAEMKARVAAWEEALSALGPRLDTADLKRAVGEARALGDVALELAHLDDRLQARRDRWRQEFRRQSVFTGPVEDAVEAPLPLVAVVDAYAERLEDLADRRRELAERHRQVEVALRQAEQQLTALEAAGAAPVEEDLMAARARRDQGWQYIKQVWLKGQEDSSAIVEYAGSIPLWAAYEEAVAAADSVVDTLRREADRSAARQALLRQRDGARRELEEVDASLARLAEAEEQFWAAWRAEWAASGLDPKTPGVMREFLTGPLALARRAQEEMRELELERRRLVQERDRAAKRLAAALTPLWATEPALAATPLPEDIQTLMARAEQLLDEMERRTREADRCLDRLEDLRQEIGAATAEIKTLTDRQSGLAAEWESARARYPQLPADPEGADSYLESLESLFEALDKAAAVARSIETHRREIHAFHNDVEALASRLGTPLTVDESPSAWMRTTARRLQQALANEAGLRELHQELAHVDDQADAWSRERNRLVQRLEAEAARVGTTTREQLADLVQASADRRDRRRQLADVEAQLVAVGDGLPVEALEREMQELASRYGPGLLRTAAAEVDDAVQELEREVGEARSALAQRQADFRRLEQDQSERAAVAAQEAESALADVDRNWNQYVRVELARRILERAVEEFRRQNQGGVLAAATRYFAELTHGRYGEVAVDEAGGRPVLTLVRADGQDVSVAALSDGTRDQLFLALRLAFLDQQLGLSEPLPLIMDDVLVHFDDPRTEAALRVFGQMARRTQVLYFTHHERVAEQAARVAGASLHRLEGGAIRQEA